MENSLQGKKLKPSRNTKPIVIDPALADFFNQNPLVKELFDSFSLSKRREYADYILAAKREATKQNRLKKIEPMILSRKGLNDLYKKKWETSTSPPERSRNLNLKNSQLKKLATRNSPNSSPPFPK